jgi:hypothetical protein
MNEIDKKLYNLIQQDDWDNLRLAGQLIEGLGAQPEHLGIFLRQVSRLFLLEFMPDFSYHRFGCTLLDRMTYDLIYNKLNEFLEIPYLEVEVCSEYVNFQSYIKNNHNGSFQIVHFSLEDYTNALYYTVRGHFSLGTKPNINLGAK